MTIALCDRRFCNSDFRHPYRSDPTPYDFFSFPRMKRDMKGKHLADVAEVKKNNEFPVKHDEFKQSFDKWLKILDKCISVSGKYFEGNLGFVPKMCKKSSSVSFGYRFACSWIPTSLSTSKVFRDHLQSKIFLYQINYRSATEPQFRSCSSFPITHHLDLRHSSRSIP